MNSSKSPGDRLKLEKFMHPDRFGEWLGYKPILVDPKNRISEVELEIREDHLSPSGRVHGGVISAFFDYACGAAVFSTLGQRDFCSTVELKVNYFRPLEVGNQLIAKSKVVFRGNRLCVLESFLYRKGETDPVAMATATFNIVTEKADQPKP